jgi:DNA modification methylase
VIEVFNRTSHVKNSLELQYLPIATVKPSSQAARRHSGAQMRKLKRLIQKYGQVTPILVDMNYTIIDGHAVHDSMRMLGYDDIMVVVVENRSDAELRALRLALNRIGEDTRWDNTKLKGEFEALLNLGFDLELTGFESVQIDMALSVDPATANTVEEVTADFIEPKSGEAVTKRGDIWRLDGHVVACGDARDGDHLRRLLDGKQAHVAFADPPYNVRVDGFVCGLGKSTHREFAMASGEMGREDFVSFLSDSIGAMKGVLADGAIAYVCMDWRHIGELVDAADQQILELKNVCAWVKTNAGMGSFYRSQHELIFVFKHGDAPHQNHFQLGQFGRNRTNVWRYPGVNTFGKDRLELLGAHPTCKPVAMVADALRDVSRRSQYVIDPFLGSGSTLIAAEETGRICVGNELDPGYVDVAIRRWQRMSGGDAVHAETGETFNDTASRLAAEAGRLPEAVAELDDGATVVPETSAETPADVTSPHPETDRSSSGSGHISAQESDHD